MQTYGHGGRGGSNLQFSERAVDGLLSTDEKPAGESEQRCKNPKCLKPFRSRQEGDDYCSDKCDSRFRGKGSFDRNDNDPSWDNAVRVTEG